MAKTLAQDRELLCAKMGVALGCGCPGVAGEEGNIFLHYPGDDYVAVCQVDCGCGA